MNSFRLPGEGWLWRRSEKRARAMLAEADAASKRTSEADKSVTVHEAGDAVFTISTSGRAREFRVNEDGYLIPADYVPMFCTKGRCRLAEGHKTACQPY